MNLLVIQSYGGESEYRRALFSILSFKAFYSDDALLIRIIVFTDKPKFFEEYLRGVDVYYIMLTSKKIASMRGHIDFVHRMKIAAIEEAFSLYKKANIIYVDSDTFFLTDVNPLIKKISKGEVFMHLFEYKFEYDSSIKMPTYTKFLNLIKNNKFYTRDKVIRVTSEDESWNAGVMGLPSSASLLLPDVYALTEQFYPETHHKACEQYAFSLILGARFELQPCDSYVYHYWEHGQKVTADTLFAELFNSSFNQLSLVDKEQRIISLVKQLPDLLEKHILSIRDRALQAFSNDEFWVGYKYAFKVLIKEPFGLEFIKDLLYHAKRHLKK